MQRRALYARAIKTNDIRTALSVLKDEAALEGLYPPTKVAPTTPDGKHPYLGASGPPLSKEERLRRLLAADGILVLEHARKRRAPAAAGRLRRSREVGAGDSALAFYEAAR